MQEIRAAWIKLVKGLHPDGCSGGSSASERLKAINQAYQRLKTLERHANQRRAARGLFHNTKAVFAASFLVPVTAGALVVAVGTYLAHPDIATREAAPTAGTSINKSEPGSQKAHPSMSYAPSDQRTADEPLVGADRRLR
jgi:curved DNA-binding protein CbpA